MPPLHLILLIDPTNLAMELGYTLIVVFLCFMIYFKTREIYDLTKYEGINYFRITFLFFGLAYIFRFLSFLFSWVTLTFDIRYLIGISEIFPLLLVLSQALNGYFSTLAILSLIYSIIWKNLNIKHTLLLFNAIAILISIVAFLSIFLLILAQTVLLILAIIMACFIKSRKISHLFILYILFLVLWVINLLALGPNIFLPVEIKIVFQIISIAALGIIYYRVAKWTK